METVKETKFGTKVA